MYFFVAFLTISELSDRLFQILESDNLPKHICSHCHTILKQIEGLFLLSNENDAKLRKYAENSREQTKQIEDELADEIGLMLGDANEIGLMLDDGNKLRNNFTDNQDDDEDSDKSLEIPGSLETDLAKDIDRFLRFIFFQSNDLHLLSL